MVIGLLLLVFGDRFLKLPAYQKFLCVLVAMVVVGAPAVFLLVWLDGLVR